MSIYTRLSKSKVARKFYHYRLGSFRPYGMLIANIRSLVKLSWSWVKNVVFYDPMIRYHCDKVGKNIVFQGTYPLIKNHGYIGIGDHVTFVGRNNLIVGFNIPEVDQPQLIIGNHVTIGYRNEINVAYRVQIGNYVRMATGVKIFDNNSHPTNAERRRNRLPMTMEDIAPVVIQDDAWIGMEAIILKGVVIGKGAIVAAGSIVTESVPDHVIVAGNPAIAVKVIE